MTTSKARAALRGAGSQIGWVLYRFRLMREEPHRFTDEDKEAAHNGLSLFRGIRRDLLKDHPQIRPIRVKQMSLPMILPLRAPTKTATPATR